MEDEFEKMAYFFSDKRSRTVSKVFYFKDFLVKNCPRPKFFTEQKMKEQDGVASSSVRVPEPPSLSHVQDPTFLQNKERPEQDGVASNSLRLPEPSLCHVQDPTFL